MCRSWRLVVAVLVGLLLSSTTSGDVAGYSYDDQGIPVSAVSSTEGHRGNDSQPSHSCSTADECYLGASHAFTTTGIDFVAPNTVRPSDLVESPLWTSPKNETSAQNALRQFGDHGAEFPDIANATEYVAKAQDFLRTPPGGTLTRVRPNNGDVVRYHPGSNTFGVMNANGAPRSLFRPDPAEHGYASNPDYFYAQ